MDIKTRMDYVQAHVTAIATDIDQTHGECELALASIVSMASEARRKLNDTRDASIAARRAAAAAKEAARAA